MKLITQITWEHIKKNRHSSLAVITAVLLSATLLSSICIFVYAFWSASVGRTRYSAGDWHGELYESTAGAKLEYIEGNPSAEAVMIKGEWRTVKLPEGSAMPYLFLRNANKEYWRSMTEQYTLLKGRIPEKSGEIAVSKLFFARNPEYRLWDTLTLATGQRMLNGVEVSAQSIIMEGETFSQSGELTLTIVGELDITTTTAYPGYYAMGYLEREEIAPDDMLTIYLRFFNMRDTYKVLPEVAESIGFQKDEYGDYALRYNTSLLGLHGILNGPDALSFHSLTLGLMLVLVALLLIFTFALIIRSVFSLSANARIKQLGMLRSVGASPGQINASVLLEGLILSALPLALSVLLGYAFSKAMGRIYTDIVGHMLRYELSFDFSAAVAAAGVLISLAAVLWAVSSTARRMTRLTPIEAVSGKDTQSLKRKKEKKHRFTKRVFGYPGALAQDNLTAYRKTYRMPVAALCLSFVLVAGTLCLRGLTMESNEAAYKENYYDVQASLYLTQKRDEDLIDEIRTMEEVQESLIYSSAGFGMAVSENMQSEQFTGIGGFAAVNQNLYNVLDYGDGWRIHGTLLGMDDVSFTSYCESLGIDAVDYLNAEQPKAIAVSTVHPNPASRSREEQKITIPFLQLDIGSVYTFEEKTYESIKSSHTFDVKIGAVTQEYPVTDIRFSNYRLFLVVPLKQYDAIVADFLPEQAAQYRRTNVLLRTDLNGITAEARLDQICGSYLGSEDFKTDSTEGGLEEQRTTSAGMLAMASGISLVFALIGISNAFSTVSGNLAMRRRDFAMLRSVGVDDAGFVRILLIEGLFFALRPIFMAIPCITAICALFAYLLDVPSNRIMEALPLGDIFLYAAATFAAMGLAYLYGARKIRKGTIVDALRSNLV